MKDRRKHKTTRVLICVVVLLLVAYEALKLCGTEPLIVSKSLEEKHEVAIQSSDIYYAEGRIVNGLLKEMPTVSYGENAFRVTNSLALLSFYTQLRLRSTSRLSLLKARPELGLCFNPLFFINKGVLCLSVTFSYRCPRPSVSAVFREGDCLVVELEEIVESWVGSDAEWPVVIMIGMDKAELAGVKRIEVSKKTVTGNLETQFTWDPSWGVKSQEWLEKKWEG